jgi:hypothetical protein
MMKGYMKKQLQLNSDLQKHKKGSVIKIETDNKGVPVDRYWRDRVKDAKTDKCVEFVKTSKKGDKE